MTPVKTKLSMNEIIKIIYCDGTAPRDPFTSFAVL